MSPDGSPPDEETERCPEASLHYAENRGRPIAGPVIT